MGDKFGPKLRLKKKNTGDTESLKVCGAKSITNTNENGLKQVKMVENE